MLRRFPFAASILALIGLGASAAPAAAQSRIVALSEDDEAAYREAFDAIESHNWRAVNVALTHVHDDSLAATVRGRMLATPAYHASYGQLTSWLSAHGDLGVANAVYHRALEVRPMRGRRRHRHPVGAPPPQPDEIGLRVMPGYAPPPPDDSGSSRAQIQRIAELVGSGDDETARAQAQVALSGPRSGEAAWELGLIAYRQHNYAEAAQDFDQAAAWPYHGGWASAAAHYWAARARIAAGQTTGVHEHLEQAAAKPWTLYGQLAELQLGRDSGLSFQPPQVDAGVLREFIQNHEGAKRAAGLAQLGRLSEAEAEMRRLHGSLGPQDDRVFAALAYALEAPSAQLRAAEYGSVDLASGFCPANSFAPADGFTLDRALIYAVVRQESYFNPTAVSYAHARGLMQLMPRTAHDLNRSTNYRRNPTALFDPAHNMSLGQNYLEQLIAANNGDLARAFAAYNGGNGWLSRWLATQADTSDALLVLETMPKAQSRDYAERVLSHMALCRKSLGQPTPELASLASGRPATYEALDHRVVGSARPNGAASQQ